MYFYINRTWFYCLYVDSMVDKSISIWKTHTQIESDINCKWEYAIGQIFVLIGHIKMVGFYWMVTVEMKKKKQHETRTSIVYRNGNANIYWYIRILMHTDRKISAPLKFNRVIESINFQYHCHRNIYIIRK